MTDKNATAVDTMTRLAKNSDAARRARLAALMRLDSRGADGPMGLSLADAIDEAAGTGRADVFERMGGVVRLGGGVPDGIDADPLTVMVAVREIVDAVGPEGAETFVALWLKGHDIETAIILTQAILA